MIDKDEIERRFTYHPPVSDEQAAHYVEVRQTAKNLASLIIEVTPESREQSLAITSLEEVVFWANAAIARRSGQ